MLYAFPCSKCNMFANIPSHKLKQAQEKVHRVRENPVFHLLHSLTKLRPEKGFYPGLDIERLYRILTAEQSLGLLNPELGGQEEAGEGRPQARRGDRYQEHMRRQRGDREAEERRTVEEEREQGKTPSIDLTAELKRLDEARLKLVLDFFTEHFLRMAERSVRFRALGQSYMYLRSAENLMALVEEMGFEAAEGREGALRLREGVNYSLYVKDYWAISYSHPGLGQHAASTSRHPSMHLPNLPTNTSTHLEVPNTKKTVLMDDFYLSDSDTEFTHL